MLSFDAVDSLVDGFSDVVSVLSVELSDVCSELVVEKSVEVMGLVGVSGLVGGSKHSTQFATAGSKHLCSKAL